MAWVALLHSHEQDLLSLAFSRPGPSLPEMLTGHRMGEGSPAASPEPGRIP